MNNYITLYGEPLEYPHQVSVDKRGVAYYGFDMARSVINGWCKSQSRGEYKRVYQSNEINAYANEACYQRI